MADATIIQGDWAMQKLSLKGRCIMAIEAEPGTLILEQKFERRLMGVMAAGAVAIFYRGMERLSCIAFIMTLITDFTDILNRQKFMLPCLFVTENTLARCNRAMHIIGFAHSVVALSSDAGFALFCGGKEIIGARMNK